MQIHELTRPRKINEVLGAVGSVLGGIAKQVGKQAINKAVGGDVTSQDGPTQDREQGFQDLANSSAAKTLATSMQTAWQETVQNFMANSKDSSGNPPTSLSQVSQPSIATLKTNLVDLVNKMLGRQGANYKNIATYIGDPTQKLYAEKIVTDIDKFIDAIYNATLQQNTTPKAMADLFTELVGKGVLIAQNMLAYDAGSAGRRAGGAGAARRLSPQAERMADQADISDEQQAILLKLGANPANHDALMQIIGVKK